MPRHTGVPRDDGQCATPQCLQEEKKHEVMWWRARASYLCHRAGYRGDTHEFIAYAWCSRFPLRKHERIPPLSYEAGTNALLTNHSASDHSYYRLHCCRDYLIDNSFFLTGVFFCVKDILFYTILNMDKFLRKERPTSPTNDDEPSTSSVVKKPKIVKRQYNDNIFCMGIFLVWWKSGSETKMRNLQRASF